MVSMPDYATKPYLYKCAQTDGVINASEYLHIFSRYQMVYFPIVGLLYLQSVVLYYVYDVTILYYIILHSSKPRKVINVNDCIVILYCKCISKYNIYHILASHIYG